MRCRISHLADTARSVLATDEEAHHARERTSPQASHVSPGLRPARARFAAVGGPAPRHCPGVRAAGQAQLGLGRRAVRHFRAVPVRTRSIGSRGRAQGAGELRRQPDRVEQCVVERYLGAPQPAGRGGGAARGRDSSRGRSGACRGRGAARSRRGARRQTPEQQAAARAGRSSCRWRTSIAIDKFKPVRRCSTPPASPIYAYRLTLSADMPDAEYDYTFNAAKALGAIADHDGAAGRSRRLASASATFAAKHRSTSAITCTPPRRSPRGTRRWRSRRATACSSTSATTSPARASARCR